MVLMISALLGVALLGLEFVSVRSYSHHLPSDGAKNAAKALSARPAVEQTGADRDCIDDDDSSDESSSCKLRAEAYRGSLSRLALAHFSTKLRQNAEGPCAVIVPLFYALCRLLL
jgi:hypothetical protein